MKISVIIPTFRRAEFLERAVKSVLDQDWPDIEVVVCDDNGPDTDDRKAVVNAMNRLGDDRVKCVLPDAHLGGGGARNAGIEAATGDYITFLDDDDIYLPHKLRHQAEFMAKGYDMSFMDVYMRTESGEDRERLTHDLPEDAGQEALLTEHLLCHLTPTAGYMFTREALSRIGGFPTVPSAQEFMLMLGAIEGGLHIGYLKESLVAQYRHAGERISNSPGKIKGENGLYRLKKTYFSRLTRRQRNSIRTRHYATLFYVHLLRKEYGKAILSGIASAAISPAAALRLFREKKAIAGSEKA